ncbi:ribosomal protein S16 [Lineolata rhizophorae]|uniref:Ribosomal protein S16 n=1 Tax=Lineolata rhizophorae TaxID=578093 RepID=A0A6A6NRM5_9PEZI|nr:ribosomal protein S16 [Lineolata rhizophorae]
MVVRIRLARFGKRHRPFYNIVVAHARTARNSKPLEVLGTYDPLPKKAAAAAGGTADGGGEAGAEGQLRPYKDVRLDGARARYWLGVGAQPSEPAWRILSMAGLLEPRYRVAKVQKMEKAARQKAADSSSATGAS